MWKFIGIILLCAGVYYGYQNLSPKGEFTDDGMPKTVLFVINNCPPCREAESFLKSRRIQYELLNVEISPEANKRIKPYGSRSFPTMVVGDSVVSSYHHSKFVAALIGQLGPSALPRGDKAPYKVNFYRDGRPRVVMYGTSWCGYCKKAKEYFESKNIDYVEWDIERDPRAAKRFELLQGNGTPLIFVGYERMDGFSRWEMGDILRNLD